VTVDDGYLVDHVRGELGRGHVHRCPRSWLLRVVALEAGSDLGQAAAIALDVLRSGRSINPREREMRRLAGRRLS